MEKTGRWAGKGNSARLAGKSSFATCYWLSAQTSRFLAHILTFCDKTIHQPSWLHQRLYLFIRLVAAYCYSKDIGGMALRDKYPGYPILNHPIPIPSFMIFHLIHSPSSSFLWKFSSYDKLVHVPYRVLLYSEYCSGIFSSFLYILGYYAYFDGSNPTRWIW